MTPLDPLAVQRRLAALEAEVAAWRADALILIPCCRPRDMFEEDTVQRILLRLKRSTRS